MGNQVSDNPEYQRMGNQPQPSRNKQYQRQQQQQAVRRAQSQPTAPKQQQVSIDSAVDTLQSMFMLVDREVLRLVLMEQCGGNLDSAVETLLAMQANSVQPPQQTQSAQRPQHQRSPSPKSRIYGPNESILYDDNMRPITMTDHFLQPPSFYLSKYYGLSAAQINNLQIQQQSQAEVARIMAKKQRSGKPQQVTINMDPSIIGQWTNLMAKYKFKNKESMDREYEQEPKSLEKCGSLVRVIFIMKLYDRICNDSGEEMNEKCGELMHEYFTRGFKEYSLTQFINDCNYLIQVHQFGGDALKAMIDIEQRNKLENQMRSYFGYRDVMKDRIIQRILKQQDNKDSNKSYSDIEVERDILDKYHRVFYHPLN